MENVDTKTVLAGLRQMNTMREVGAKETYTKLVQGLDKASGKEAEKKAELE